KAKRIKVPQALTAAARVPASAAATAVRPMAAGMPPVFSLNLGGGGAGTSAAGVTALVGRAAEQISATNFLLQSGGSSTLAVSVGYADNLRSNSNFPVPWQGSPNVVFLGAGPTFDAGAIRLDNLSNAPLTIDSVFVDLGRPGPTFNLWGRFTIPAESSAILTQTGEFNFDTSDFPITGCGHTAPPTDTRIPTVTVTIAGVGATFSDTGHILDTGGFDLACQGNESLAWRPIGTTGIQTSSLTVTLAPKTSIQPAGTTYTATASVTDAANQP